MNRSTYSHGQSVNRRKSLNPLKGAPTRFKVAFGIIATIIVLGFIVSIAGVAINATQVNTYADCQVTRTETTIVGSGQDASPQKRVYTDNCGVFTVEDNLFHGVWNSADIYGSIKEGNTYTFEASGIRVPLLSWFPNVINVTPAS